MIADGLVYAHPGLDFAMLMNGTIMGFSMEGNMIDPTWYPEPENAYNPVLLAAFVFNPTTSEFSSDITVSLSTLIFAGDEGQQIFASDMEFIHLDGTDVSDNLNQ